MTVELDGEWRAEIGDGKKYTMHLPGTLDGNRIGFPDIGRNRWHPDAGLGTAREETAADAPIPTRFTRKYTYEGAVRLTRSLTFTEPAGKRVFLEAERARCLSLLVDGSKVPCFAEGTLSTPYVFEVTGMLHGTHEITLVSDNSYPGLPHDDILYSSAATDETQTNWNGVLGYLRLRTEDAVFLEDVRIYPSGNTLTVKAALCADMPWKGVLSVVSDVLKESVSMAVSVERGRTEVVWESLELREGIRRWDEYEGCLYSLTVSMPDGTFRTADFGVRDFAAGARGRLELNGRTVFLRGETNCAVFPETGHAPMSVEEWEKILRTYRSYGVNCVRFHSHCPPEAAFTAADRMGMLMQPELSHWNPKDAFGSEESETYYRTELLGILRMLANHPSFVMLTLGNELHASEIGHKRMQELLTMARTIDSTRLYADGSNTHYGEIGCDKTSDFYTAAKFYASDLRGTFADMEGYINRSYPDARTDYHETMERLRKEYGGPVFGFEVGQFEVLPDFGELEEFHGVSLPVNLELIRERVGKQGLAKDWGKYVEATGELARIGYREEVEAAMRTEQLSGIFLLGMQDFPGQGTALVGMLNSHLQPKPFDFARPEAFRAFFTDQIPLVLLPKYTYENTESLQAEIRVANYGKQALNGDLRCRFTGQDFDWEICLERNLVCPPGELTHAGMLDYPLAAIEEPVRLTLTVSIGSASNCYPVWVYPPVKPVCPEGILETRHFDDRAKAKLKAGGTVYLSPPSTKEALPNSIQAQFTTDFWSVGTFAGQEGGMGQLIDAGHPVFRNFPTEFHSDWQWWAMATQRAVVLPERYKSIVTEMDSFAWLRPMTQLMECRCSGGKLLFSSMGLQNLQRYPEARALLASIYRYLDSEDFTPEQEIGVAVMETLVK